MDLPPVVFLWQTSRVRSKLFRNVDRFISHFIRYVRVGIHRNRKSKNPALTLYANGSHSVDNEFPCWSRMR